MQENKDLHVFQMLSTLLVTISRGEQILQCIRQVITLNPLFNPISTFKYLTKGANTLLKTHIIAFLEDNSYSVTEDEINILFKCYGYGDQMTYSFFLNYIYPVNSGTIRQITNIHIKRYPQTQKLPINQEIITGLFILLTEQIQLIRKLEAQKSDTFLSISKDKLKRIIKSVKKASQKQQIHCRNQQNIITCLQLRSFVRSFIQVADYEFLHLSRKMKMDKNGAITFQQLQFWLKSWKKNPVKLSAAPKKNSLKEFNEQEYRKSIRQELNGNLQKQQSQSFQMISNNDNTKICNLKCTIKFKQFVKSFIYFSHQIQTIKKRLNSQFKINLISLFKKIDTNQKGTINAEKLRQFYQSIGCGHTTIDFRYIIKRYSQLQRNQLTLSQFCQIFNEDQNMPCLENKSNFFNKQGQKLISLIIDLNLQCELKLDNIRKKFKKGQSKQLFDIINKEKSGFINYQEIKRFLTEIKLNLSMKQLMLILKKFDRKKNGVVLQNEFINYFDFDQ